MYQMTIFDFEPSELENIPIEQTVERIGQALGLTFKYNDYLQTYQAKIKQYIVSVNYSRYTTYDANHGDRFISCGIDSKLGGSHSPEDSVEEAIAFLKACLKLRDLLREPKE